MKFILSLLLCVLLLGCITSPLNSDDCIRTVYVKYTVSQPIMCSGWEYIDIDGSNYYYTMELKHGIYPFYTKCDDFVRYQHWIKVDTVYVETCT